MTNREFGRPLLYRRVAIPAVLLAGTGMEPPDPPPARGEFTT